MKHGLVPLHGLDHSIAALDIMTQPQIVDTTPVLLPGPERAAQTLSEYAAKTALAKFGVPVPTSRISTSPGEAAECAAPVGFPVALKVMGLAHKTGANGLALNLHDADAVVDAAQNLAPGDILVEAMVTDTVAEVLLGVTRDPAHGFMLTLGFGGTLTEVLADTQNLLLPTNRRAVEQALGRLRMAPILQGYRGKPGVDMTSLLDTVMAVQDFVITHAHQVEEVEINPLMCSPHRTIAADALIRMTP